MDFIRLFETQAEMDSKFLRHDVLASNKENNKVKAYHIDNLNKYILYTSTDGATVTPYSTSAFGGATIVSNVYNYGQGIIEFDRELTSIGNQAFYNCSSLASIEIPDSVTSIGNEAFYSCSSLASITCYAMTAPTIQSNTFQNVKRDGILYVIPGTNYDAWMSTSSYYLGYYNWDKLSTPFTVNSLTNQRPAYTVYANATNVKIVFDANITVNGKTMDVTDRVTISIEKNTTGSDRTITKNFTYNGGTYSVTFVQKGVEGVLENQIWYTSTDGAAVTPYSTSEFGGATIVSNTYAGGKGIIEFDRELTSIGGSAFQSRSKLASIEIPESVTSIGNYAFNGCSSLASIVIPNSVASIGNYAFNGCSKLASITCYAMTAPTIQSYTFNGVKSYGVLYVISGTNYNTWMSTSSYYLGYYNWGKSDMVITVNSLTNQRPAYTVYANTTNVKIVFDANITVNGKTMDITDKVAISIEKNTTGSDRTLTENFTYNGYTSSVTFTQLGEEGVPRNQIYYTNTNGATVTPYSTSAFGGATIVSNTYAGGQGVIEFDIDLTSIGSNAFKSCSSLASVEIPDSVTSIGSSAFSGCSSLANIVIPDSVTSIGENAFYNCSSLASIVIPDSVTSIGTSAFYSCSSLASIVIPDSVTSIGSSAFSGCSLLASIEIGNGVTSIGSSAFSGCSSLASIVIPNSVTSIGSSAFYNCSSLASITCYAMTAPTIQSNTFQYIKSNGILYVIPGTNYDTWMSTSSYYLGYYNWGKLSAPFTVNSLTNQHTASTVYANTTNVAIVFDANITAHGVTLDITDSVTISIEKNTTGSDRALTENFTYNGYTSSVTFTQLGEEGVPRNQIYYTSTDGATVTPYSTSAFGGATIVSNTYAGGQGIIEFDRDLTSIGNEAFKSCSSLASVEIPNYVTSIGSSAFSGCSSLANIVIGNGVTSIGNNAFQNCSSLANITCYAITAPAIQSGTFNGVKSYGELYVISGTNYDTWMSKPSYYLGYYNWTKLSAPFTVNSLTNQHTASTVYANTTNVAIVFDANITAHGVTLDITDNATITIEKNTTGSDRTLTENFTYNGYTASVTFVQKGQANNKIIYYTSTNGATVTPYSTSAFGGATIVSNTYTGGQGIIEFDRDLTSIGNEAFKSCSKLASIEIPDSVTSIGSYAFAYCSYLASIEIPDSVTSIGERIFSSCSSLANIEIPDSVTSIGNYAFYECSSLANIEIPDSVTSIRDYTFQSCSKLVSIVIPDSVTSIGSSAFQSCSKLANVEIGNGVTSIGSKAFYYCSSLTNITCYRMTAPTIQSNTFQYIKSNGILYVIPGTNYDTWMSTSSYYLGYYNWGKSDMVITVNSITNQRPAYTVYANATNAKIVFDANITVNGKTMDITDRVDITIEPNTTGSDRTLTENFTYNGYTASVTFVQKGVEGIPGNQIWYTSTDGSTVTPYSTSAFGGATIVSNTYADGKGIIEFDRELTSIGYRSFYNCSKLASIEIPDSVTSIVESAFYNCSSLTSIVIPDSVTSIGNVAFNGCSSLASIEIPDSVTSIGTSAFYGCSSLASIEIGNGVTSIGSQAFYNCSSLASIEIGNGVTSIGEKAFYNCSLLTSIEIPDSVTSIGNSAFYGCSSLASIVIPDSVTTIGTYAFQSCSLLASIEIGNGVTSIGNGVFYGCSSLASIVIPDSVTSIGSQVFSSCSKLASIEIPDSVTSIGDSAFSGCSSLESIEIPDSVTSIGSSAFSGCSSLESIVVSEGNTKYDSRNDCNAIVETATNKLIVGCKDTVIPDSVTSIGSSAFQSCSKLTNIDIPNSVTSIGYQAFYSCSSLENIVIGNGVTSFGNGLFQYCSKLASITCYAMTAPTIQENTFKNVKRDGILYVIPGTNYSTWMSAYYLGSYGWTQLSAPFTVNSLTNQHTASTVYANTTNVTIVFDANITAHGVTLDITDNATITIEKNTTGSDRTLTENFTYNGGTYSVTFIQKGVEGVPGNQIWYTSTNGATVAPYSTSAFGGATIVSNAYDDGKGVIEFDRDLTSIGNNAFKSCSLLASIEIPDSVTSIGSQAFYGCSSLASIEIPDSVTSIGDYAFQSCSLLASIEIPDSVTSIGSQAFKSCSSLASIVIPDSVTSIGSQAFSGCSSLESIVVSEGNTKYDSRNNCYAIVDTATNTLIAGCKNTVIPDSVTSIGSYAFSGCSSLESIVIGNGVTSIGEYAFQSCSSLASIVIGNGVTSIGYGAFSSCSSLASITCYAMTAPTIQSGTFQSVKSYGKLYVISGTNYNTWMSTSYYYLGYYGWTKQSI